MESQAQPSQVEGAIPSSSVPTTESKLQVGFVGLGNMGRGMALNLAKGLQTMSPSLNHLMVYNRTTAKAQKVKEEAGGAVQIAQSVEEIGKRCQIVFVSISNDEAALDVFTRLCNGEEESRGKTREERKDPSNTIFVDTSTIYPATTGQIERFVSAQPRRHFIAAPCFGPPPMACAASLIFAVAGPYASKQAIASLLVPHMGRKIMDFGSNPERAATFKLIGNSMLLGVIELLSETMTLADKTGVGSDRFYEFIQEFFPAPSAISYGKKILTNAFSGEEGFSLDGGIKDCTHIRRLATSVDCPMGVMDQAHAHMIAARANGGGDKDWSSLVGGQRLSAGLDPWEGKRPGLLKH
ncbi:NAD(P)-binding protein [Tilletiaria anomala UBC 951]|uniref:NAD(P)-binding protein n=1 Tax=Tilletiaria anomala (strain ATCC 24038 / CBS 436.72 / UBC 951) TaxID=1037660 RepID=A0A066VZ21_TILAU|nr:NAD(P)-binding protein [Tilletiaria anomala UBC 951]KDN44064.1 NAD(P)-binding protein [Tilletiaria anomala UBC 951]